MNCFHSRRTMNDRFFTFICKTPRTVFQHSGVIRKAHRSVLQSSGVHSHNHDECLTASNVHSCRYDGHFTDLSHKTSGRRSSHLFEKRRPLRNLQLIRTMDFYLFRVIFVSAPEPVYGCFENGYICFVQSLKSNLLYGSVSIHLKNVLDKSSVIHFFCIPAPAA